METLKIGFFILGSAASLGFIIFFLYLIFNKDNGIDLEQGRINYLSLEVERLDKKISKKVENEKCPLDFYHSDFVKEARIVENEKLGNEIKRLKVEVEEYSKAARYWKSQYDLKPYEKDLELAVQKQQFDTKEKMYLERIRQLEKEVLYQKLRVE